MCNFFGLTSPHAEKDVEARQSSIGLSRRMDREARFPAATFGHGIEARQTVIRVAGHLPRLLRPLSDPRLI
jgi:hypothetical protein